MKDLVSKALAEDVGSGDVTSIATLPATLSCRAKIFVKEPAVLCGGWIAEEVFHAVDESVTVRVLRKDGERLANGETALEVEGSARSLLTAERTALNLLQHLSGIATRTAEFAAKIAHTRARLLDTRKTLPGLRALQKYAVRCGGGTNHRIGLYDMVLVKDNHLGLMGRCGESSLAVAVRRAREMFPGMKVEAEAETPGQVRQALDAGADIILLDNMDCQTLRECVAMASGRALLEASGGITLETAGPVAETGVDFLSVGALTHSVRAVDFSMEIEK